MVVSFDVKSLFTNIPLDFEIDLILNKIYDSNLSKTFHGLTKRQLRILLVWTTQRTTFNFNGNSYDQIDGVAMGSPIASAFADIFMNWVIEKTTEFSIQPLTFYRYVDDCFAVFPNRVSALKFHHDLNTIHKDVKFTYELEHNKQLAFLDVSLDNSTGSIELFVHRKPTHTELYNKWESLAPLKYKTNLIWNLLHRAYRICSNSRLLENETQAITNLLKKNGYPGWIIRNTTQKFFNKQHDIKNLNKSDLSTKRSNKHVFVFFKLQYLHRISTQIEKEIRFFKALRNKISNIAFYFQHW